MKRIITAGILLLTVIILYFIEYFYVNNTCKTAEKMLSECITAYENEKDAESEADDLEKYWQKKEKPLSLFANHSEIDEIELAIATLKVYSATESRELFSEYSGTVKTLIHQLLEDTVPSVHSIL